MLSLLEKGLDGSWFLVLVLLFFVLINGYFLSTCLYCFCKPFLLDPKRTISNRYFTVRTGFLLELSRMGFPPVASPIMIILTGRKLIRFLGSYHISVFYFVRRFHLDGNVL